MNQPTPQDHLAQLHHHAQALGALAALVANYQTQYTNLDAENRAALVKHLKTERLCLSNKEKIPFHIQLKVAATVLKENQDMLTTYTWLPDHQLPTAAITAIENLITANLEAYNPLLDSANTLYKITCKQIFLFQQELTLYQWEQMFLSYRQQENILEAAIYLSKLQPTSKIDIMRHFKTILDFEVAQSTLPTKLTKPFIFMAIYAAIDCKHPLQDSLLIWPVISNINASPFPNSLLAI